MKTREKFVEIFRIVYLILCVIIVLGIVAGLLTYAFVGINMNDQMQILTTALMMSMISLVVAMLIKKIILQPLKHILMNRVSQGIENFRYIPNEGIPICFFEDSGFIKNYDEYFSDNFIAGKVKSGKDFIISEIIIKQVIIADDDTRRESVLFDGIFGVLDANKTNTFYMNITPDFKNKFANRVFADFKKMLGNKHVVRLENPEFERYFEVFSDNQIESRKIITLEFMEKLLEIRKKIGKNISVIYTGNKIYFFIQHATFADTRKLLFFGPNNKLVKQTSDLITSISETVELL